MRASFGPFFILRKSRERTRNFEKEFSHEVILFPFHFFFFHRFRQRSRNFQTFSSRFFFESCVWFARTLLETRRQWWYLGVRAKFVIAPPRISRGGGCSPNLPSLPILPALILLSAALFHERARRFWIDVSGPFLADKIDRGTVFRDFCENFLFSSSTISLISRFNIVLL